MGLLSDFEVVVGWELDSIEILATEAYARVSDLEPAGGEPPDLYPRTHSGRRWEDALSSTRQMMLECAMQQLNSTIDGVLMTVANWLVGPLDGHQIHARLKRHRKDLIADIQSELNLSLNDLPGWAELEGLGRDVNALKHRFGVNLKPNSEGGFTLVRSDRDREAFARCLSSARIGVASLLAAVSGARPSF